MFEARKDNHEVSDGSAPAAATTVRGYAIGLLVALAIGAAVVAPYFFSHSSYVNGKQEYQMIATHDMTNHYFYMDQFEKGVRAGEFYPRWFAEANNGYGIAVMNFYPPGFYYTTTLAHAVFSDWHTALFVLMALMMAGSGAAMYWLAHTFFSRAASVAAALVYMLLPYHLLDLYWRGALPETFGFIFLPLILYFAYKAGSMGTLRHIGGLGLLYGLYLLTHFPVGLMFSYALAFYVILWALRAKDWRILLRIAIGMTIGLAISAIYWLPAALEMKLVYEYTQEIFPYHLSYIQGTPTPDRFAWSLYYGMKLNALLLIVVWLIYRLSPRADDARADNVADATIQARRMQISLWLAVGGASLFMTTAFSYDIGRFLPKIELTVPPFRWLAIACMFGALLAGAGVERLWRGEGLSPRRLWALRAAFGLVIALNLYVTYSGAVGSALKNGIFAPPASYVESSMTPREATHPEQLPDTPMVMIEPQQGGTSNIIEWSPQHREVRVQLEQPSRVRLKTYNFSGWTARVDGNRVPLASDDDGIQIVEVPAGVHTIETRFQNTAPRWAGIVISLLGFLAVLGLTVASRAQAERRSPASRAGSATAARRVRYAVIGVTVLVALVIIALMVMRQTRSKPSAAGVAPEQRRTSLTVGSQAALFIEGQEFIFVADDEPTLGELLGAVAAKEDDKVESLVHSGRVKRVANNSSVQVMEMAAGRVKVRILEGEHAMQSGWVIDRWVR